MGYTGLIKQQALEQRILSALKQEYKTPTLDQAINLDFEGKNLAREKQDLLGGLECSLRAAKGYECFPKYEVELAYVLDRAAKYIDGLLKRTKIKSTYARLRYAELKERAGQLFLKNNKPIDAAYAFLWASLSYAFLRDYSKAGSLISQSDELFKACPYREKSQRIRAIVMDILQNAQDTC